MYRTWRFITVFKVPAIDPCSEPDESCPLPSCFIKIQFKIPHCICEGLLYSLFAGGSPTKTQHISRLSRACHMELLIMQLSPACYYFPHQVQSSLILFFLLCERACFTPIQNNSQHFNNLCVNLYVFILDRRQDSKLNGGSHSLNLICP